MRSRAALNKVISDDGCVVVIQLFGLGLKYTTMVDCADYPRIKALHLWAMNSSGWYIKTHPGTKAKDRVYAMIEDFSRPEVKWGRHPTIGLHRFLLNLSKADRKVQVDHINNNTLDNRRCNLRGGNVKQNSANRDSPVKYGYIAIAPVFGGAAFAALVGGRKYGAFATPEEAAVESDIRRLSASGDFARLNFDERREEYLMEIARRHGMHP